MAVIGNAEVIISPITRGFEASLRRQLQGMSGNVGARRAGQGLGEAFDDGFNRSLSTNPFGKFADGLRAISPEAEGARLRFQSLVRTGYVVQAALGAIVGAVSSVVVSIGTLVGVLGKAAPAVAVLASAFVTLRVAMSTAKFGFGDIASAVKQATEPTAGMTKTLEELREEFQQLQFDAEQAALSEGRAALNLETAFENLRRVQDLPPNSAARREAQLAYEEADLAYRRAKDRAADLNDEVGKGIEGLKDDAAGTDPFAGLNEAQREFAEYLVTLQPLIDDLELRVSRALLPPLRDAVEILRVELLPILQQRLPDVAGQVGEALKEMVDGVDYDRIDRIFAGMTEPFEDEGRSNIQLFGDLLENILDIFLQITEATAPLLNDFLTFLVDKTGEWATTMEESDLVGFFEEAGGYASDLGEIMGNVFGGLGNLIGLTTGPGSAGEELISWLKESTEGFENMFAEDPEGGKEFFRDAMVNTRSVFSSIGALLKEILGLADNPNIALTFDKLKEGAPAMGEMLEKMIDAGPSFAGLIETITTIANELTDTDQISAFFDTLNLGAEKFLEFIQTDGFKRLLDNIGPVFAALSAFGVLFDVLKFGFKVILGYMIFLSTGGGKIIAGFQKNFQAIFTKPLPKGQLGPLTQAQAAQKTMIGRFAKLARGAGIVGIIVIIISKMIEFYDKFEDFRTMVDTVFGNVKEAFERMMEPLSEIFEKLFGGEGSLLSALDPVIKFLLEVLVPILGYVFETIMNGITLALELINNLLDWIIPVVTDIADALGALFEGDILGFFSKIFEAFGTFIIGGIQFVVNSVIDLINFGIRAANDMISGIANSPFGSFLKDVFSIDLSGVKFNELAKVDWTGDIDRRQNNQAIQDTFSGSRFGGPDSRVLQSTGNATASTMAESRMRGMPEYAEYSKPTEVNVTVNAANMDPNEMASAVSRELAIAMKKGTV